MYSKLKSCIIQGNEFSDFFACEVGVRQGENVSLSVFIVYKWLRKIFERQWCSKSQSDIQFLHWMLMMFC